jgi:indole-3-glycerol phosphate synthase
LLSDLYFGALEDARARSELVSIKQLEDLALRAPRPLDAIGFLRDENQISVIAEIKRASPSKGKLAEIPDPASLAKDYIAGGAKAISVLTEGRKFLGSLDDFNSVREISSVPLLRKDFIANEYQVLEARAHGADIVLLIVAGLELAALRSLKKLIEELGMTAFVETHNQQELEIAAELGASMIGINARDLSTFETDRNLFARLANLLPKDCIKVAESAVRNVSDVEEYAQFGADAVLVGEALVRGDARALLQEFSTVRKP